MLIVRANNRSGCARTVQNGHGPLIACLTLVNRIAFPRWVLAVGTALLVIWMTVLVAGLIGIYIADEYLTPAFSEQSVPPPRLY